MKEINDLKKAIKTYSFIFTFILILYLIKGLFAFMENDLAYLGLITDDSYSTLVWLKFIIKFISNIIFFIGVFFLVKTLNFNELKEIFSLKKILLFEKTGKYFLRSAGIGSLTIVVDVFDGKFASLKGSNDFLFSLYFSLIIGLFFYIFSKVLKKGYDIQQENDLTI